MKHVKAILAVWLLAFGSMLAFYVLVLTPERKEREQFVDQLDKTSQRLEFLNRAREMRLEQVLDKEISQIKTRYSEICFSESDLNMLDFRIHEISQDCNLRDFSSRVLAPKDTRGVAEPNGIGSRHLLVSFGGSLTDFVVFINKLERHEVAIFVDRFTLNMESQGTGATGELHLSILYTKKDKTSSDKEQAPQDAVPVATQRASRGFAMTAAGSIRRNGRGGN
jgi:hypothetical protein